ncbi:MAG: hypothetical protein KDD92_00670 [Caldilineaceae bacterium]|nr:hypothetical protein [Caldilineaceae bacterium]
MQSLPSRKLIGPALAGLALLLVLVMLRIAPDATGAFQSPLPTPTAGPTPMPTITPTPIVLPNGWYRHVEEEAGFQIDYPPEFVRVRSGPSLKGPYTIVRMSFLPETLIPHTYQGLVINVAENPEILPIEEWAQRVFSDFFGQDALTDFAIESVTLDAMVGYQVDIYPGSTDLQMLVPYDDRIYVISSVYGRTDGYTRPESLELFYEIINTFAVLPD